MKCMIVEDELPAVKILQNHISHFSDLEVTGIHHHAMSAFADLQKSQVDILFLDIQLPKMSGIQLLHAIVRKPAVILTTAYREFALDGYELEITDYLLKPISFERFTKAIAKVYQAAYKPFTSPHQHAEEPALSEPFIYIKCEREFVKILLKDLLYVESIKNHVKLVTTQASYITLLSISQLEEKLPAGFLRIHRSFVVSLQHISRFTHASVNIQNKTIPVGRLYKMQFLNWVSKNML